MGGAWFAENAGTCTFGVGCVHVFWLSVSNESTVWVDAAAIADTPFLDLNNDRAFLNMRS